MLEGRVTIVNEHRFSRNAACFGTEGQEKIHLTSVSIVGVGGVGSHVVQQLAYLGTRRFCLVDDDIVTESSLNRLMGATARDVELQRLKVDVAERTIRAIIPDAMVQRVPNTFVSIDGFAALREADVVIGCVDGDGSRLILTEFCAAYKKPYFDLATEILPGEKGLVFGGRLLVSIGGVSCPVCLDELSPEDIRRELTSRRQLEEDVRIYGLQMDALRRIGPSVVSLNGVVASLAVTEFMVMVTGIRDPKRHLTYRGDLGWVTENTDPPMPDCYYCKAVYGRGEEAVMERYLRAELATFLGKRRALQL